MFRNDWLDILDPMLARQHIQNAAFDQGAPQQQAAPQPMQLPPAPPAFAPRPVRYNAPKRQPLIRMGSPLQTGFWGALSLLAPQLATGYLRGRQMSQEQEQQDAMLQYKAAMDEEQQRRQASQDEWDQWGKQTGAITDARRLDLMGQKAEDPRQLRAKVVAGLVQQGKGVTPELYAWSLNPDPNAPMPAPGPNEEGGRLWKAIQDSIVATQRNNTGLLSYTGNTNTQYVPGQASPVVNPNPVPLTLSPGGKGDATAATAANNKARLPGIVADSKVKVATVPARSARPGLQNQQTIAQTGDIAKRQEERDRRYLLSQQIAEQRARTDRERIGLQRERSAQSAARRSHQTAMKASERIAEYARKSNVDIPTAKMFDALGIAPGPQALATFRWGRNSGLFVQRTATSGDTVNLDGSQGGKPGYPYVINLDNAGYEAYKPKQDRWRRGELRWIPGAGQYGGREAEVKPAGRPAAPKAAPSNPMKKAAQPAGMPAQEFQKLRSYVKQHGIKKDYLRQYGPKEYGQLSPAQMKALFG